MMYELDGGPWKTLGSMVVGLFWWFDDPQPGEVFRSLLIISNSKLINLISTRRRTLSKPAIGLANLVVDIWELLS